MSRQKVPYAFKPLPDELPLIWQDLDLYPRLIIQELWRMSDNGLLKTRLKWLVRDMRIAKKGDRGNAQNAVTTLIQERLLREGSDGVRIAFEVRWDCVGTTEVGSSAIPTPAKVPESLPSILTDQIEEIKEESRSRARERVRPPEFKENYREPDPEPTLEEQITRLWRKAVHDRTGRYPGQTRQVVTGASQVASWLRENVRPGETELGAFQAALKLYMNEDKQALQAQSWPLAWMVERLPGYLASSPASPIKIKTWQPPTWMDDADSEARRIEELRNRPRTGDETVSQVDFSEMANLGREFLQKMSSKAAVA